MKSYSFYYSQLSEEQKKVYMTIYTAWKNKQETVTFDIPQGWEKANIPWRIRCDHPLLFYVSKLSYTVVGKKMTLYAKFPYTNSEIDYYTSKINERIAILYNKFIKDKKTEYEKEIAIHDCLCRNVKYDNDEIEIDKYDKENHNVLGTLFGKCGVCEGFAKTFKLLCDLAKIRCLVVMGEAYTESISAQDMCGHAWNVVYVDNKPYHVDVTWDITLGHVYDYFNLTDKAIFKDHKVDDDLPIVHCNSLTYNYFYYNQMYANSQKEFNQLYKQLLREKKESFSLKANFNFDKENMDPLISTLDPTLLPQQMKMKYSINDKHNIIHFFFN